MIYPKWIVDTYLRCTKKSVEYSIKELNTDRHTETYEMPKSFNFPRPIEKKIYNGMEVFESPSDSKSDITLLYFHGSAYIHSFNKYHWKFLIEMAKKTGCALAVPNYLKLPKYTAKISNEVTLNFYEEFTKTHDMSKVVIAGDSAGAGLAMIIIQRAIKMGLPIPNKAILISPWVDVTGGNPERNKTDYKVNYEAVSLYGEAWQKGMKDKDPFVSPLYGDMKGFPKTYVWVGGNEVLYDDVLSAYEKMKEAGVDVSLHYEEKDGHDYPLYPTKNGKNARKAIAELIKK